MTRASARSRRPSAPPATVRDASSAEDGSVASGARGEPEEPAPPAPAADRGGDGFLFGALAVVVALVIVATASNVDRPGPARYLVPVFGLLVVAAVTPMLMRRHPEEPWLARFLVLGVVVKLAGSWLRYYTLTDQYDGVGDATKYHEDGSRVLLGIEELSDLRKTNFVRWFTSEVYSIIGIDFLAGFFVYGLLAFLGAYLWYRATAEAVPFLNRKLYCGLLFFAPSLMFWPSSIGKEALMMLGMGAFAVGVMNVLGHRVLRGAAVGAAGGWLLWVVRPHLLALVTIAGAVAYFAGRKPVDPSMPIKTSLLRPIVMVTVAFATVFAVTQAADFLEMDDLSLQSIEAELAEQTGQSSQGGSKFENPDAKLTPLSVPQGMVTVLLRPFPWEVQSPLQILASVENVVLAALIFARRRSVAQSLRRFRAAPFLLYCWTLMLAYSVAFASFANFGLLARQRSLVLPALYVLISLHLSREADAPREPNPAVVPDRPLVPV